MVRIEENNWENSAKTKAYLTEVCRSLTGYLEGGDFKISIAPDTNLKLVGTALRELAEMFECSSAIMARTEDRDPFAPPSDDEYDSADFWKK